MRFKSSFLITAQEIIIPLPKVSSYCLSVKISLPMIREPRRLEVAPSKMNDRSPQFPTLIKVLWAAELEAAG